jgi:hypothetical protein
MPLRQSRDSSGALNRSSGPRSSVQAVASSEHAAAGMPPADSDDVSVTNSEVERVMNHRRRRETLRHAAFADQEFNAFNSVDAYLGAARTCLEGIAGLFATKVQVCN